MVTSMQVFQFKKETLEFLGSVCNHAMETTPLQSLFTRCLKFFTPNFIVESSRSCKLKFEKIRENLVSCKQLPSREADTAKLEFSNFLSTTVKENKDSFVKFDKENDRSYIFIGSFSLIPINLLRWERCSKCWWYCPMVKGERGFSVNGELLVENFHTEQCTENEVFQ